MEIFIAAYNDISEKELTDAKNDFSRRFDEIKDENFVNQDADVIWFLTGGSEHNALKQIEPQKRYCFIANQDKNSWAAATEVKALLNEKGIKTRIFDYNSLENLDKLKSFLNTGEEKHKTKLAVIGKPENWLVASVPDYDLIEEVLGVVVKEYSWTDILNYDEIDDAKTDFKPLFEKYNIENIQENTQIYNKLKNFIKKEEIFGISVACFDFIVNNNHTVCLPVAGLNTLNIPATCEGDLCANAGMIVLKRLTGKIPWMANLNFVNKEFAIFSHCTVPIQFIDEYKVEKHYESSKESAINGTFKKGIVTVFRIDHQLEYCFLSLGEVIDNGELIAGCKTQVKVKLSRKSLFLLREFPLGNHHLIMPGDYTDILAEYFSNRGFRIV